MADSMISPVTKNDEYVSLALQTRAGDMRAGEKLAIALHDPLFFFLRLRGIPNRNIEDLAQKTMIEVFRGLPRYDSRRDFLVWCRSVARNVTSKHWRFRYLFYITDASVDVWSAAALGPDPLPPPERTGFHLVRRTDPASRLAMEVTGDAGRLFALRIYPVAPETIPDIREFERLLNTVPKRKRFGRVVLPNDPASERLNVREILFHVNPKPAPFEY